jgi:hypothetical protein
VAEPISREKAEKRIFEKHGNKLELLEYTNAGSKSFFHCNICGNYWYTTAESVWSGKGCRVCAARALGKKQSLKIDYVKNYIESFGCKLCSVEYKNSNEKLNIIFECGHEGKMCFSDFREGKRCRMCGYKRGGEKNRLTEEEIKKRLLSKGLTFIRFPDGYINIDSKIIYECNRGHVETRSLHNIINSKGCIACTNSHVSIIQKGELGNNWKGGLSKIRRYLRRRMDEWKKESANQCNYLCVIEKTNFDTIHHLYGFNLLLQKAFECTNIPIKPNVGDYKKDELDKLVDKISELHNNLLGVCLTTKSHRFFHKLYGQGNNTPEQFYEFKQRIESGELVLPE